MRRKMGAAARERAIEHFTVDRAISAFDEMYTRLGSSPDQAPAPSQQESAASSRSGHWITLPAEEESTVVGPRPDTVAAAAVHQQRAHTDEEVTQILPAFGRGWPAPGPGSAVFSGTLASDMTQPLTMLRATWPGLPVADPEVPEQDKAEPDVEQTMILPVVAERSAELLPEAELSEAELSEAELSEAELSEANRGDEGEEQFTERGDEDRTTAGSQLTEAMR